MIEMNILNVQYWFKRFIQCNNKYEHAVIIKTIDLTAKYPITNSHQAKHAYPTKIFIVNPCIVATSWSVDLQLEY